MNHPFHLWSAKVHSKTDVEPAFSLAYHANKSSSWAE